MRFSLKAKLTGLISFLVLLVVLATSTLYLSSLTRQALIGVESKGEYVADEIYNQARTVLAKSHMPPENDPNNLNDLSQFVQQTLAADPGLASLMQSAIGYSPTLYYVTITDTNHKVLIHDNPDEVGQTFAPAPRYSSLVRSGLIRQFQVIYGPPKVYEVVLPLEMAGKPLGDVRVGVSTLFLRDEITPELRAALILSVLAILFATFSAGVLSFRMLRPLETISQSVDRMARGEYPAPLVVKRSDEWGILSSKLNLLGEQMRGEKAAFVKLKEDLDRLFSNLADGLLLFDGQDRLVLATPAVSRFLGRATDELAHHTAEEVFSGEAPLNELLSEAFRSRQSIPWQTFDLAGETEVPRVTVNVEFVEEAGTPVGSSVTLRDASTRAQLENQIDISAKLVALGKLSSGVAHEIKNPLNAMVLQLEILKAKLADEGERVVPELTTLSTEIRRLDRVVKTFLDFNRPVELHPAETDIESLVREVFTLAEPHARKNNVQLVFKPDGLLPRLRIDRDLMKQALLNLVLNGCQAMPSGGDLQVIPRTTAQRVELEISDQGIGIPLEEQRKIFSLFHSTRPGGTGVGLAMTFRIVQLHNGSIDFRSQVNQGTVFRISLPR